MNELTVFNFENKEVRTVEMNNNIYFVASDVCKVLEHSNPSMALSRLDEDEKGINNVYTPGGSQEVLLVNESGLYSLVLTSRKPEAKRFKKWITSEVIPSIRKTGAYGISTETKILDILIRLEGTMSNMIALTNNLAIKYEPKTETKAYFQPSENKLERNDTHLYHRITFYGKKFRPDLNQEDIRERAKEIGMMASRLSKERRIRIHEEENLDSRYPGKIRYYHQDILSEVFRLIF
jgi:prophage antirepressor-like protein